jgi:hypothetical protein
VSRPSKEYDFIVFVPPLGEIRLLPRAEWDAYLTGAASTGYEEKDITYAGLVDRPGPTIKLASGTEEQSPSSAGRVYFARALTAFDDQEIRADVLRSRTHANRWGSRRFPAGFLCSLASPA